MYLSVFDGDPSEAAYGIVDDVLEPIEDLLGETIYPLLDEVDKELDRWYELMP